MNRSLVIIGAQWGDEGKGKVIDLYSSFADIVVRYSGGANAGHTLVIILSDGTRVKLATHLIPSGIVRPNTIGVMAGNMVIEWPTLLQEMEDLRKLGIEISPERLKISRLAHLVLPIAKDLDGLREAASGGKIGTTKRGIGQSYELKAGRVGIRFADLLHPERFMELAAAARDRFWPETVSLGGRPAKVAELVDYLHEAAKQFAPYITNVSKFLAGAHAEGKNILYEGSQGTELDIDHGTYPFVTSGNVVAPAVAIGTGLGMHYFPNVYGVTKAYCTRVGGGPFPTELKGELGEQIRKTGAEYGATTGRPRRVGWLDMAQLRHAARVNGLTGFVVTKLDILRGIHPVKICLGYGKSVQNLPDIDDYYVPDLDGVKPLYLLCNGFDEDISGARQMSDLPAGARQIVSNIEIFTGVPVVAVSVGPSAEETIVLKNPLTGAGETETF